jgi:hypothetical protein
MQNEDYFGGETTREKINRILANLRSKDTQPRYRALSESQGIEDSDGYDGEGQYEGGARKKKRTTKRGKGKRSGKRTKKSKKRSSRRKSKKGGAIKRHTARK